MNNEFTCAACQRTFNKERSDDEAMAESQEIWGAQWGKKDLAVICDDCFKAMGLDSIGKVDLNKPSGPHDKDSLHGLLK